MAKVRAVVVGVSTMGQQIGSELLLLGFDVTMVGRTTSTNPIGAMQSYTARRAPPAMYENYRYVDEIELLPDDAELVIEAVSENLAVKRAVLERIEENVSPTCVIATNTSSIDPYHLQTAIRDRNRFIAMHFFNPTWAMKFVEVAPLNETSVEVVKRIGNLCLNMKMEFQIVQPNPGFVVNRLLAALVKEAKTIHRDFEVSKKTIDKCCDAVLHCKPFDIEELVTPGLMAIMLNNLTHEWDDAQDWAETLVEFLEGDDS